MVLAHENLRHSTPQLEVDLPCKLQLDVQNLKAMSCSEGHGDLLSRLITGITEVIIWLMQVPMTLPVECLRV